MKRSWRLKKHRIHLTIQRHDITTGPFWYTGKKNAIVGKVSQLDILRSLEPKYEDMISGYGITQFGFSKKFMKDILEQYALFEKPMEDICRLAGSQKVKKFMSTLTEGEFIDGDASLDEAIHLLVIGRHQSLLVTHNSEIVGILRLTDVFGAIFLEMKRCYVNDHQDGV